MTFSRVTFNLIIAGVLFTFSLSVSAQDDTGAVINLLQSIVIKDKETLLAEPRNPERRSNDSESRVLARIGVQTTETIPLTLREAIARALENNNTVELSRDDVRFQETQVRSLKGSYDPVFNLTPNYTRSSTTGSTATNDFSVNSNVFSLIRPGGGNYTVFFNNSRTENAFTQAQVSSGSLTSGSSAIYSSGLGIRYNQPLFRNLSIDNTRRNIKVASKRLEQTDFDFRRQTIDTITLVQRAYWELVFALRDQQNRVANLDLSRENLRQIEARIAAGAAAPIAKAEVETELATREADVLVATQQVSIAENNLKELLIGDPTSADWNKSFIPTDAPVVSPEQIDLDDAMQDARNNRFELRRLRIANEINDIDIKFFRNQTRPQIDLNTSFSLSGFARSGRAEATTSPLFTSLADLVLLAAINDTRAAIPNLPAIPNPTLTFPAPPGYLFGGFNRSLGNLFRSDSPNFSVGLTISFPFRNQTAKANLAGAEIVKRQTDTQLKAQEQAVIVEVRNAVQAVETARQRVAAARRGRENAEIQLEGERRLFDAGRSTTFLLFQRENALTNARNSEIRAETDYRKAIADLQRVTATTLERNNIILESPIGGN